MFYFIKITRCFRLTTIMLSFIFIHLSCKPEVNNKCNDVNEKKANTSNQVFDCIMFDKLKINDRFRLFSKHTTWRDIESYVGKADSLLYEGNTLTGKQWGNSNLSIYKNEVIDFCFSDTMLYFTSPKLKVGMDLKEFEKLYPASSQSMNYGEFIPGKPGYFTYINSCDDKSDKRLLVLFNEEKIVTILYRPYEDDL